MEWHVDIACRSLFRYGEELCGDKVQVTSTEDSVIAVLSDGLGSGVKANILSTLTSSILATMLHEGAAIDQAVETIVKTLPVCSERGLAYSTFSVLQVFDDGNAYLVEFDNPPCIYIRNGEVLELTSEHREVSGKRITESHFQVQPGDVIALISDGMIYAGAGEALNFGWNWDAVSKWLAKITQKEHSAPRLASSLSQAVNELYLEKPGDDSTDLIVKIMPESMVNLMSGPPLNMEDDAVMVHDFMGMPGNKIISGGTSSNIAARTLSRKVQTLPETATDTIPPMARMDGVDFITEGVVTLGYTVELLREYKENQLHVDPSFFRRLDEPNGAARIARMLLEECTQLNLFIGTARNTAHQQQGMPSDIGIKLKILDQLSALLRSLGKKVDQYYY